MGDNNHLYKFRGVESTRGKPWHQLWKSRRYRYENADEGANGYYWCVEIDQGRSGFTFWEAITINHWENTEIVQEGHEAGVKCEDREDIGTCVYYSGDVSNQKLFRC